MFYAFWKMADVCDWGVGRRIGADARTIILYQTGEPDGLASSLCKSHALSSLRFIEGLPQQTATSGSPGSGGTDRPAVLHEHTVSD